MQKLMLLVASVFALNILISCKKNNSSNSGCVNTTGWCKNGHEMVYANDPIYIFADSLYITLVEVSPGIFQSTSVYDDGTSYPPSSNYAQPCGNSFYQAVSPTMANKQEAYRSDGNVGDSWNTVTNSSLGYTVVNTTTITAKNVSVTVPAGTFSCIQLHSVAVSSNPNSGTVENRFLFK